MDLREDRFTFKGDGMSGTATKNSTTNFDYKITASDRCITGMQVITQGSTFGDYVVCQVVDKDNVIGYGADTVLATYAAKWFVEEGKLTVFPGYISDVLPLNIYIRLKYTSVGTELDVKVAVNLYLHQKKS